MPWHPKGSLDEYLQEYRDWAQRVLASDAAEEVSTPGDLVGLSDAHNCTVRQPYAWTDRSPEDLNGMSPEELSEALKEYARLVGVTAVGVTATQTLWHYGGDSERDRIMAELPPSIQIFT